MHALYIAGQENDATHFNGEAYYQFPYNMSGMTITNPTQEIEYSSFFR